MPTYAYMCQSCQHEFDAFQSIKAKPLRVCPACGRTALKRLIGSGAGIIFKGSGFYCTDYRGDGYKNAASAETGTKSKSDEKKPDAKPAATPEAKSEPKEPKKKTA